MKNLERFRLQGVCLFKFELRGFVLLRGGEQHAECEVQLHILFVRCRESTGYRQCLGRFSRLKIGAHQIESSFDRQRMHALKMLNAASGVPFARRTRPRL